MINNIQKLTSYFIILTLLSGLLTCKLYSQHDYRPAYIINLNHDTIPCFIDYNGNMNYECYYKKTIESEAEKFKPFEIISFRFVDDKYFISKEVIVRNSYIRINELEFIGGNSEGKITQSKYLHEGTHKENVYLEFLVEGEINLYYLKDKEKNEHYFLETKDGQILDLTIEEVQTYCNGVIRSIEKKNVYQNIIKATMSSKPEIFGEIKKTGFQHRDLIELTKDYHNLVCKDQQCIIYQRKLKPMKVKLDVFGGVGYAEYYSYYYTINYAEREKYFKNKLSYFGGIDLHFRNVMPNWERISFKVRSEFLHLVYSSGDFFYINKHDTVNITLKSNNIDLSLQAIQNISTKASSPYFVLGISGIYSIGDKISSNVSYVSSADESNINFRFGVVAGFGYEFSITGNSRVFVELMHEQRVTDFNTFLLLGYEF